MIAQKIIRMNCRPETAQIRYARSHGFFARVGGDTWQLVERPLAQLSAALDALRDTAIGEGAKGALARQRESLPKLATYVESFAQSEQGIQSQVRESLSAQRTTFDPRANKLLVAVCPLRTDLVPEYSAAADDWATNLCGGRCYTRPGDPAPQYELLLDWIAVLTLLDASAPLLYMRGAAQLGKSAFVNGLARLWREAGPAQLANCFGRFNGELTACPLSFADEVFPKDENGRPNTQIFRRFNEARNHSVERKYKEIVSVVGCTRQVAAENGTDMFDFRGQEITADDVVAIGSRLLVIDCFAEACEPGFVRRRYDFSDMESLVESDAFARWALWLRDNHKVTSGRGVRGLCRSNGQSFVRAAANSSGLRAKLLQHAVESVILMADSKPLKRIVSGVACDGGRVGVNTLRISKLQSLPVFDGAPNVAQLQTALQAIRGPKREVFKPRCRADEAESEATRSEYTVILAAELTRAAAELGRGDDYAAALAKLSR